MNETDYNKLLYEKMKTEQDKFREWLFTQEPSEILNHTYEYTMREDIVMCMEELELSQKQAKEHHAMPPTEPPTNQDLWVTHREVTSIIHSVLKAQTNRKYTCMNVRLTLFPMRP